MSTCIYRYFLGISGFLEDTCFGGTKFFDVTVYIGSDFVLIVQMYHTVIKLQGGTDSLYKLYNLLTMHHCTLSWTVSYGIVIGFDVSLKG